jgi:DNA-binding NarL/FixJ family response regulator
MRTMLFVDDHPIYRDGLQRAVTEALRDLRILVADGASSALELLSVTDDIDFCLSDYRLVGGDGVALLQEVRRRYPGIAIGLLCADPTEAVIARVRGAGAVACLSKDRDTDALAAAIDTIFNGGTVFDDTPLPASHSGTLSIRRREILLLAGNGQLDKQIGEQLCISESTVRNHWQHIFIRLQASNRTEAVAKAMRLGMI